MRHPVCMVSIQEGVMYVTSYVPRCNRVKFYCNSNLERALTRAFADDPKVCTVQFMMIMIPGVNWVHSSFSLSLF